MKKLILSAVLSFAAFSSSAQLLPGAGYQAILYNPYLGQTIDIRANTLELCLAEVDVTLTNNFGYRLVSSCRAQIFGFGF